MGTINTSLQKKLTSYLRGLSRSRSSGVVTAADATRFLLKNGIRRRNIPKRLSYIRSTLRTPQFRPEGYVRSPNPASRSRVIRGWIAR